MVVMKNLRVAVKLIDTELEDEWQESEENSKAFGNSADIRWFKQYDVYLSFQSMDSAGNSTIKAYLRSRKVKKTRLASSFFHISVCSPAMMKDQPKALAGELKTAIVQNKFDETRAMHELRSRILDIIPGDEDSVRKQLDKILYILPNVR